MTRREYCISVTDTCRDTEGAGPQVSSEPYKAKDFNLCLMAHWEDAEIVKAHHPFFVFRQLTRHTTLLAGGSHPPTALVIYDAHGMHADNSWHTNVLQFSGWKSKDSPSWLLILCNVFWIEPRLLSHVPGCLTVWLLSSVIILLCLPQVGYYWS